MTATLWHVRLTSFRGVSPLAVHYYVTLNRRGQKYRVERILAEAEAEEMTEMDGNCGRPWATKAGQLTQRFDTEEDALAAALAAWQRIATGPRDALIQGDHGDGNPPWNVELIAGPSGFVDATKALTAEAEGLGWYDHGRTVEMDAVTGRWRTLLDHYELRGYHIEAPTNREEAVLPVRRTASGWVCEPDYDEWAAEHAEMAANLAADPDYYKLNDPITTPPVIG